MTMAHSDQEMKSRGGRLPRLCPMLLTSTMIPVLRYSKMWMRQTPSTYGSTALLTPALWEGIFVEERASHATRLITDRTSGHSPMPLVVSLPRLSPMQQGLEVARQGSST